MAWLKYPSLVVVLCFGCSPDEVTLPDDGGGTGGTDGGDTDGGATPRDGGGGGCTHPMESGELLWITFDDAASTTSPRVGDGSGASATANEFEAGRVCDGIRIDDHGELVTYGQMGNIDFTTGTLDFWYLPDADHRDNLDHMIFRTSNQAFISRKAGRSNGNAFQFLAFDSGGSFIGEVNVDPDEYAMSAGVWVNVRITWDFNQNGPAVRIYFDGAEASRRSDIMGPATMPTADPDEDITFGGRQDPGDTWPIGGVLDELRIWETAAAP